MLSSLRKLALAYYDGKINRQDFVKQRTLLLDRLVEDDATVRLERKGGNAVVVTAEEGGKEAPAKNKNFFFILLAAGVTLTGAAGWLLYGVGFSDLSSSDLGVEVVQQSTPSLPPEASQFGRIILPSEKNRTEDGTRLIGAGELVEQESAAEGVAEEPKRVAAVGRDYAPTEDLAPVVTATEREIAVAERTENVVTLPTAQHEPPPLEPEAEPREERVTQQEEQRTPKQEVQAATTTTAAQPQPAVTEVSVSELNRHLADTPQFMPSITVDDVRNGGGHFWPPVDLPAASRPPAEARLPERVPPTAPIAAPPATPPPAERPATPSPSIAATPPPQAASTVHEEISSPASEDRIATNQLPSPSTPGKTAAPPEEREVVTQNEQRFKAETAAPSEERRAVTQNEQRFKAEWDKVIGEVDVFRERLRKERLSPSDIEFFSGEAAESVRVSNRLGYSSRGCWILLASNDLSSAGRCFHNQYQQNDKNYEALRGLVEVEYRVAQGRR